MAYLNKFLNTNEDFYPTTQHTATMVYMYPAEEEEMSLAAEDVEDKNQGMLL